MSKEEFIARVRYLGWICFQMGADLILHDVPENFEISAERLQGLIEGTKWALDNPEATPSDNHDSWVRSKQSQGYVYGDTINVETKTHPSLVAFEELPEVEKKKDEMDMLMVRLANELYQILNSNNEDSILNNEDYILIEEERWMKHATTIESDGTNKRQTITFEYDKLGGSHILYSAIPSCEHEIVSGDNCSGIKCRKCNGWYCA